MAALNAVPNNPLNQAYHRDGQMDIEKNKNGLKNEEKARLCIVSCKIRFDSIYKLEAKTKNEIRFDFKYKFDNNRIKSSSNNVEKTLST